MSAAPRIILDDLLAAADRRGYERARTDAIKMVRDGADHYGGQRETGHEMLSIMADGMEDDIAWVGGAPHSVLCDVLAASEDRVRAELTVAEPPDKCQCGADAIDGYKVCRPCYWRAAP